MELYKEILAHALSQQRAEIVFPDLHMDAAQIVELECYKALQKSRPSSKMTALGMIPVLRRLKKSFARLNKWAVPAVDGMILDS